MSAPKRPSYLPAPAAEDDATAVTLSETEIDGHAPCEGWGEASSRSSDEILGRTLDDRYFVESVIGRGGIGRVYRARHVAIDRRVAVKVLRPELLPRDTLAEWFLREARAANRVAHANIVDVTDIGRTDDGLPYIVMELLVGEPLSAALARGPLPIDQAVAVLEQVCSAVARAHDVGIVHRDLKPGNVFLVPRGGGRRLVKLLDFGLALVGDETEQTGAHAVLGTPEYMAPEVARGSGASPLSDLYSMGVLFFEVVTGQLPFECPDRTRVHALHAERQPPAPSSLAPGLPVEVDRIILRLMEKDPRRRHFDAHHLLEDLRSLARDTPLRPGAPEDEGRIGEAFDPLPCQGSAAEWALRVARASNAVAASVAERPAAPAVLESLELLAGLAEELNRAERRIEELVASSDSLERWGKEHRAFIGRTLQELGETRSLVGRRTSRGEARGRALAESLRVARGRVEEALTAVERARRDDAAGSETRRRAEALGAARAELDALVGEDRTLWSDLAELAGEANRIDRRTDEHLNRLAAHCADLDGALGEKRRGLAALDRARQRTLTRLERAFGHLQALRATDRRPTAQKASG